MAHLCSVANCASTPGVTLHKYPLYDEELFKTWVMRTNNPRLPAPDDLRAYKNYYVCGKHFLDDCLMPDGQKLKQFALPTIDCPGYFGEPTVESSYLSSYLTRKNTVKPKDTVVIDVDHCYTGLPQDPVVNIPMKTSPPKPLLKKATSAIRPLKSVVLDASCDDGQPQNVLKSILKPTSLKYQINEKLNAITVKTPPVKTLLIDLDKDEFQPEKGVPPGTIFLDLDNDNSLINNKAKYKYSILNTKASEKAAKNKIEMQQVLLDLDIENFIIAKPSNTENALDAPIFDLTGDDDPVPSKTFHRTKEYVYRKRTRKPFKYDPPRERSVPIELTGTTKKSDRTTPKILLHNKKALKETVTDTLPPPPIETEISQKPELPPPINKIDDKKLILERIQAKKLLIKKKRQDAVDPSLTLLKPTAISYVPVEGSYKTTVFVHSLRNNDKQKNNQTVY